MAVNAINETASLDGVSAALVGPGRVGSSLGLWLHDRGVRFGWVVGRSPQSIQATADALGAEATDPARVMHEPWDLLLIAVPDHRLAGVAATLATAANSEARAGVALHTSGSQSAEVLEPLREVGLAVGSLHPLLGFPRRRREPVEATVYCVDGDDLAQRLARSLVAALSGSAIEIDPQRRLLYHYTATLAAGGVSTVLAVVDELIDELGLEPAVRRGMLNLTRAAIDAAAENADAAATITGPIARGDAALAARQLHAAADRIADLEPFLRRLHAETQRQVDRGRRAPSVSRPKEPLAE